MAAEFVPVGNVADVPEGTGKCFSVAGRQIAVFLSGGKYYALDDRCTHAHASLSAGPLEDGCVMCPWHYAQFDLATGEAISLPAVEAVGTYAVRVSDGKIQVAVDAG